MAPSRRRARPQSGVTLVEFALVFPIAALMLMGIVVLSIVVFNQLALNQAVRVSARAVGICGSVGTTSTTPEPTLPNGTPCTSLQTYVTSQLSQVSRSLSYASATVSYRNGSGSDATCTSGDTVTVQVVYNQPLFVPLVGDVIGNAATNTFPITAIGEATCEQ